MGVGGYSEKGSQGVTEEKEATILGPTVVVVLFKIPSSDETAKIGPTGTFYPITTSPTDSKISRSLM